ncbi:N-acetylmuramoyl-L-alanine amidase [Hyphococcus luteus]|uniref:N-acetylmuramoyl-L-alanine amidase n=1 Tax=Hyphococcus luteus TaxID=2058213 RepID=A0A2S7K9A8_9PROT|nr:N-acetylmuramoyl-L-alanine amidase [Marinicaulis flavus]PQA89104.1 N-acetylmuramoyl-L-alanine amidase [Marinicaulis flavus]
MKLIDAPSPNFDDRKLPVDTVILHYTGMETGAEALKRLQEPGAKVSAHYLVEENGDVYKLVEEDKRAWHAGVSYWKGDIEMNGRSIGVEIVNPGHQFGYRDFPDAQIASVIDLLKEIRARHKIDPARVIGHSDVAPRRKEDPGEKFPWKKLSDEGLALAPFEGDAKAGEAVTFEAALEALSAIGYDANLGDYAAGLLAFQRRFCPQALGQGFDPLTRAALISVKEKL